MKKRIQTLRRLATALSLALCSTAAADLAPPADVAATDGTLVNAVGVSWSAVDGAAGYRVYRKVGPQPPMMVGVATSTNFSDLQAMPGTLFEYTVRAFSGTMQSPPSAADTGWRNVPAPANLVASDGTVPNGVALQWMPSPGAAGYRVYRGAGESELAEIAAPNQAGFLDATAVAGTVYTYVVRARTAPGNSAPSNADTGFRSGSGGGGGGLPPTGVSATDGTRIDGVAISWNAVDGATGYRVYRGSGPGAPVEVGTPSEAGFLDASAGVGIIYSYSVRSRFEAGDSAPSMANSGWRNVPAPTNLAATDGTVSNGVGLTWNAVPGSIGYRVFRGTGTNPPMQIAQTAGPAHLDVTAMPGVTYTYVVRARAQPGDSAPSEPDTGFRAIPVPGELTASDGRSTQAVEVRWNPIAGVAGYRVFRALPDAEFAEIAAPNGPFLNDATAVAGTLYAYRVCGRNADGSNTEFSNVDTGWRNVPAPMGLQASDGSSTSAVNLTWSAVPGAIGYRVFRIAGPGEPTEVGAPEANSFADETAAPGVIYSYRVSARTAPGNSRFSQPNSGWRNVPAPAGVAATDGTFADKVVVSWTPSESPAVQGYAIFRQLEGQPNAMPIGMVQGRSTASFNDVTIPVAVVGTYFVRAKTAAGLSAPGESNTGFRAAEGDGNVASGDDGLPTLAGEKLPPLASPSAPSVASGSRPSTAGGEVPPTSTPGSGAGFLDDGIAASDACEELVRRLEMLVAKLESADDADRKSSLEAAALLAELALDPAHACRIAAGDVNGDGSLDAADFDLFLDAWTSGDLVLGDLNRDGAVDGIDLMLFASGHAKG